MADNSNTTTPCYVFRLIKFDEQGNKIQKRKYGFTAKTTAASELNEDVFNGIITRAEQTFNLRPSTYSLYLVLGNLQNYTNELGETDLHLNDYPALSSHSWTALHTYNQFHFKRELIASLKADKKGRKVVNLCLVQTTLNDVAKAFKLKKELEEKKAASKGKGKARAANSEEGTIRPAHRSSSSSVGSDNEEATAASDPPSPPALTPEIEKEEEDEESLNEESEKRSTSPAGQAVQEVADLVAKLTNFIAPLPPSASMNASGLSGNIMASHPGMEFIKRAADFIAPPPASLPTHSAQSAVPHTATANPVDLARSLAAAAAKASGISHHSAYQSFPNKRRHWSEYLTDEIAHANAKRTASNNSSHSPAAAAAAIEKTFMQSMESASRQAQGGINASVKARDEALKNKMDAWKTYRSGGGRSFFASTSTPVPVPTAQGGQSAAGRSTSSSHSSNVASSTASSVMNNDKYATLKTSFDKFVNDFNANLADAFGGPGLELPSVVEVKKEEKEIMDEKKAQAQTVFEAKGEKENASSKAKTSHAATGHHHCRRTSGAFEPQAHNATCDVCDDWIVGVRYKCFVCPDWDCCEKCFTKVDQIHPGHALAALQRPVDLIRRNPSSSSYDNPSVRHISIHCDGCNRPITGIRFKCTHPSCPDFDLCATCEADPLAYTSNQKVGNHSFREHLMVKIRNPVRPARGIFSSDLTDVGAKRRQLERAIANVRTLIPSSVIDNSANTATGSNANASTTSTASATGGKQGEEKGYVVDVPLPFAIPGGQKDIHLTFDIGKNEKGEDVVLDRNGSGIAISDAIQKAIKEAVAAASAEAKAKKTVEKATTVTVEDDENVKDEKKVEQKTTAVDAFVNTQQNSTSTDAKLMYDASWMTDVTFGDGESVFPGTVFNKIWEVRNTGARRWPAGTRLICVSGFGKDLTPQQQGSGQKEITYTVKSANPGATVQIVAEDITAPEVGGKFMSYYRFVAPDGTRFGDRLWIDIVVDDTHQRSSVLSKKSTTTTSGNSSAYQEVKNSNSSLDSSRVVTPILKVKGSAVNIQEAASESAATTIASAVTSPRSTASGLPDTESMGTLSDDLSDEEEDCDFVLLSDDDEYDQV